MIRIIFALLFSVISGVAAHLLFYPVVTSWHNERVQLLARPAIGVFTALPAFLVWHNTLVDDDQPRTDLAAVSYLTAFLLHGAGVALGYVVDDIRGTVND